MTNRILTGIFSTWASFLLTAITSLIMAPFLVHRLGNEGYGLWSLYMAITGYFTLLDFGVSPAIVRYTSKLQALGDKDAERRILVTGLAFFSCASLIVLGVTLMGTAFYDVLFPSPAVPMWAARMTFLLVGLDFTFTLPFAVFQGILLGHQRYLALNGLNILIRLLRFALVIMLVKDGAMGLVTVAVIFFVTGLVRDLGMFTAGRSAFSGRLRRRDMDRNALRELLSYSIPAFVISMALRVMAYTDSLVIGYTIGVGAITYFALAASLVDYVQELGWGLAGVLVPVVSAHEARGELDPIREKFLQFTRYCVWMMAPVVAITLVLAKPFFTRWVGAEYHVSAEILILLMWAMAVYVIQLPAQAVLKGMSLHRRLAMFMAIEAAMNLVISIVLARQLGVIGVALGTLIPRLLMNGLFLPAYIMRVLAIPLRQYLLEAIVPVIPGVVGLALLAWGMGNRSAGPLGWPAMVGIGLLNVFVFSSLTLMFATNARERSWLLERSSGVLARVRRFAGST